MCGIAGILHFDGRPVDEAQLSAMTNRMIERGPDDDGFYVSGPLGLGFRRLSIIDVAGGKQPLTNEDGTLQLVLNGEIYNYVEIREQLLAQGHIFKTKGDAEVVLHLYEEKGVDALDELNGMFAFALWDSRRNALWIARDRLGIKPLFYASTPDQFIFASDTRALRAACRTEINPNVVLKYLALAYAPGTDTVWGGIRKLPPAHYLWIDRNGSVECKQYWTLSPISSWRGTVAEAADRLEDLLADATKLQMRSDVPIGIFLSGGLDSSAIVSFASQVVSTPIRTFTINFRAKISSDARFAKDVAARYGTSHRQIEMGATDAVNALDTLLCRLDEPLADSALLPAYLVSQAAHEQGIKVLLNGAGGDEIFGGYQRYWPPRLGSPAWVAQRLRGPARHAVAAVWSMFQPERAVRASDPLFAWAAGVSGVNLYACRHLLSDPSHYAAVITALKEEYAAIDDVCHNTSFAYRRMNLDLQTYLPNDILSLTDKATMAASVEGRFPLLDHRLVEFAGSLPSEINLYCDSPKGLFKKVLAHRLPTKLLSRKKEGFNAPLSEWMLHAGALNIADELLYNRTPVLDELLNPAALKATLSKPTRASLAAGTLFSLYLFNRWHRAQTA